MNENTTKAVDWNATEAAVRDFVEWIESDDYHEDRIDDYENAIVEAAVEATFGPRLPGPNQSSDVA